ncbi:MAG: hypothetical protein IPP94_01505 [Ignavibacteria bacterium]|nr:hypothetical protein [Ignavibacteria bacterium]
MTRALLSILVALLLASASASAQKATSMAKASFPRLAYVDLSAELGLQSDVLAGFGARVDNARRLANADALASEAVMLSFIEETAGKTAQTVTALRILDEAAQIIMQKRNEALEKVVVAAAAKIPGGEQVVSKLRATLAEFTTATRGEGTFIGYVKVQNASGRLLDIYIDGKYAGFLYSGEDNTYSTGNGTTQVRVTDAFGNTATEIVEVRQNDTFAWTINP